MNLLKIFFIYFDIQGSIRNVMAKANHLRKLLKFAKTFFTRTESIVKPQKAEKMLQFVKSLFNSKKRLSRELTLERKSLDARIEIGVIIFPKDFSMCAKLAKGRLQAITGSFETWCNKNAGVHRMDEEQSLQTAIATLQFNRRLTDKWRLNFLALLLVVAGGQRPQIYW